MDADADFWYGKACPDIPEMTTMKKTLAFCALSLILMACSESSKPVAEDVEITAAKKAVIEQLKDPNSAEFKNVGKYVATISGKPMVCGQVNAKNSMGGYVGFRRFAFSQTEGLAIEGATPESIFDLWCSVAR